MQWDKLLIVWNNQYNKLSNKENDLKFNKQVKTIISLLKRSDPSYAESWNSFFFKPSFGEFALPNIVLKRQWKCLRQKSLERKFRSKILRKFKKQSELKKNTLYGHMREVKLSNFQAYLNYTRMFAIYSPFIYVGTFSFGNF